MPRPTTELPRQQASTAPPAEPISMRIPDACRFTGISRSTLYLLIAQGEVEIVKLGSSTLVITESLRRFIAVRRRSAAPHACASR